MSNLHNGSKLRKKDVHSIREAVLSMVQEANLRTLPERRVSDKAAITVANRDLQKTKNASVAKREFSALRAVGSFISLATINKATEASLQNSDLLPVGHPFSTKAHSMTAASLRNERAKWIAADEYIDSSVRSLVIKAHGYEENSMERAHAFARLAALGPAFIPITASIDLNTATSAYTEFVFGLGLGGNSDMARRLRAKMQRRDRRGRFAFMGGGFSFSLRDLDGLFSKVSGRVVGASGDKDSIDVEVKNHPKLADGIYSMPSSRGTAVKGILDDDIIKDLPQVGDNIAADDVFLNAADLKPMMAPTGWTTKESDTEGGKAVSWVHTSEDGYEVIDKPGDPFGRFQLRREQGNSARQPFPKVKSWADVQKQAISDQDLYKEYLEKEQINQDKNKAFDEAAKSGEGPPRKASSGKAWVKHENGQWYERELGRNYDLPEEDLQKIAKDATGPYRPPADKDFGKGYKTSKGKWKEWDEPSDEISEYRANYQSQLNREYSNLKRLQEAQKAGLFDPKSDKLPVRDIVDPAAGKSVGMQVSEAIISGESIKFNYNGKFDVTFTPKSGYTNKKTGERNIVGLDAKGVQRTYTESKMAPPKSAAKTEAKATIPDAPEAPPADTTPDVVDLNPAGMKLDEGKKFIADAVAKKQKVRFNYSGSERVVEPIEVWVNGQTGRINLRAMDKDVKKNFSFDKIEAPKPSNVDVTDTSTDFPMSPEERAAAKAATDKKPTINGNSIEDYLSGEPSVTRPLPPRRPVVSNTSPAIENKLNLFYDEDGNINEQGKRYNANRLPNDQDTDFPMSPEERAEIMARPSERVTNLDGLKGDELTAAIDKAIADKKPLKFTYHEKERLVRPLEVWTNPKTGKVNLRAVEADADTDKNFTLEKIGKPIDEKIKQIDADDIINMPQEQLDDVVDALWPAATPSQQVAPEATGRRIVDASGSTAVGRVEYDPATKELFIQFKSSKDGKGGGVYKYSDVAPEFVDRLESGSIGKMIPELKKNNSSEKLDEFPAGTPSPAESRVGLISRPYTGPELTGDSLRDIIEGFEKFASTDFTYDESDENLDSVISNAYYEGLIGADVRQWLRDLIGYVMADQGKPEYSAAAVSDSVSRTLRHYAEQQYNAEAPRPVVPVEESLGLSFGHILNGDLQKRRDSSVLFGMQLGFERDNGRIDASTYSALIALQSDVNQTPMSRVDADSRFKAIMADNKPDIEKEFEAWQKEEQAVGGDGPGEPPAGGPVDPDKYETEYGFDYPKKVTDENGNQVSRVIVDVVTEDMSLEEIERDFKKKFPGGAMKVIRQRGTNGWPEVQYDVRPGDEDKLGKWYSGDLEPYDYAGEYETEYGIPYPEKVTDEFGDQVSRVVVDVVTEDMSLGEIKADFTKKFPNGSMKVIRQAGTNGWPEVQYDVSPGDEEKLGKWYRGDLGPYDYAGDADALDDADTRNLPTEQDYMDDPAFAEDADAESFFDEQMFDSLFDTPDGAYKLNVFEAYRPVGRTTEDSEDFTDDPDVLATKFDVTELGRALAQAVLPITNDEATGYGNLPFESGDEPVKAEALYEALAAARMVPNIVLAGLYDSMLDPERGQTNVERVTDVSRSDSSLDSGIDDPFTAEILPVADRSAEIDAAIALNEKIGSYKYASNGVQLMRNHSENNQKMLDIAKDLTQREDDDVPFDTINLIDLLDKYLPWASSSDANERDAFKGLWGMMMSLDGGSSIESDSRFEGFRREILSSFERRSGNPTLAQDDYDEFILQYGGFPEFVAGKKAIADGQDDLSAETSAAAFFRLVKASSRPNTVPLWRSIGVAEGSSEFEKYTVPGSRFDMDPRSFTSQSLETGTFGDIAYSPTDKKIERVIFKLEPGDADTISAESVSWFPDERENFASGSFEVIEVTRQPSQLSKTRNDDYVVRIRKVDGANQTDEQDALPAPGQFSEATQHGDISGWTQVGNQAGSNPGGFYDDPAGNSYYIKQARSQSHADNEALASAFYKELGVPAAEVGFGEKDGVLHLVTPLIDGATPNFEEKVYGGDSEYVKKVQDNFAVDAWLANYDVTGMVYDNVVSDANGEPVRVDPGGSLMWRAQGKPKTWFGDTVDELDSMRDPDVNEQAANVFGTMNDDQIKASAQKVANLTPDRIEEIIDSVVTSPDDAALLKERLLNRRQYIMDRFGFGDAPPSDGSGTANGEPGKMSYAEDWFDMLTYDLSREYDTVSEDKSDEIAQRIVDMGQGDDGLVSFDDALRVIADAVANKELPDGALEYVTKNANTVIKIRDGEPTDVLGEPQSIASEMGIASKDLQAGDVTVGDSFVIERIFTDADTKKGKVSVQGYFPGHESQVKQWNENTVIMATRGGQLPAKGDAPALHRPVAPAKPQNAAFTGSVADALSGAKSWDEVRSILRGKEIVFFDYETTGFPDKKTGDNSTNQPVQLGAVKVVDGQIVDRFNLFMNPEEPLGGWSRDNLKGADGTPLTDEQLATAMDKGEAHQQFIAWAGQGAILAAHNAPFDIGVLNDTLGKKGLEFTPSGVIDTLKLAQTVIASKKAAAHHVNKDQIKTGDPSGPDTHRLGDLASHFGVELGDGWHTADADSEATSNVAAALIDYAAGLDDADVVLRSVLDAGDSYQSNMAEFEARSAQFKDELANYEIQKAIAAAWNCRGGTVASIAALIAAIDDPDCNVPSIDDLIKAATPGGTDFVDPEGLHTGDSSTGDAYTLEAEEIPEMDGIDPPFIPGIEDPDDEFRPSDQQQAVVEALFTGGDIVIRAAAGAGKTSTLKILARRLQKHKPKERVAYIAFNATVAAEARESMPSNVEVRTADSISFNWTKLNFPKLHKKKGAKDTLYSPSDIATHLKVPAMTGMDNKGKPAKLPVSESVKELRKAIYQFTISADKEIGPQHFDSEAVEASDIPKLIDAAERWWADILSENGKMLFGFNHMKKMWALSNPDLSDDSGGLKTPASVIFMDEAQDINPVLGRVIAAQTAQKVYVGDENQAIYQFMGAEDELQKVTVQHDLPLTKSYRFGEVIARNANRYLRFKERFLGEKKTFAVEGAGKFPGEIVAAGSMKNAQAVLVRSNAGAFREVRTELLNDRIVGVTKGFKADLDNFIIAVDWLQAPEATRGSRPMRVPEELRGYKNWAEIVDEAAKEGDSEFSRKTRILVDDVEQLGLEELKSLASRVKVLKGKVNTKVVDDGSLPDLPDDLSPGVEGDVGRDITFSVEEDAIVLRGSTYGVKDQIKTANGGPAKYDGDRKAWIIPAKTDKARQAGLEKLQKVLAPETVAEASYVDVVVSSVHQAKGAEWDDVRMGNDFFGPRKPKKSDGGEDADWIMPTPVELNLAYVGVTRAKKTLDPGSLNWIDSWVKSDDPEIMGLVDGVVVAPEAPEAPTAASEDDSSAPTTSPDVDDEVAETAETIESVGEAVEGTDDPFGPGGQAPSAEQQAKDLTDSFDELSDYADSITDPEGDNNLKTGAKSKVKKAQKDLKQLQKDLEDGSVTQAEAATKLQQMIDEFPDSDSNTDEALDMWAYRQSMIDLQSVLTGERYMRPTGKGLPPRDAVDSKGRPVGFSKDGKFLRPGTRVRDKWGFSGVVDSYNENDWINVNVRYDIDPRDPDKVKKGKWGPGVARVSKNSRTLTVIEPGDREPWIDNGSVPENKKPKQIEEQTRIYLDMLAKRGETEWDGSEKDRQEPGGDLPKVEAPQGAPQVPENSVSAVGDEISTPAGDQSDVASRMPDDDILVRLLTGGGSSDENVDLNKSWADHLSQYENGTALGDEAIKKLTDFLASLGGKRIDVQDKEVLDQMIDKKLMRLDETGSEPRLEAGPIASLLHGISGFTSGVFSSTESREDAEKTIKAMKERAVFANGGGYIDSPAMYGTNPTEKSVAEFWTNFAKILEDPSLITDFKKENADVTSSSAAMLLRALRVADPLEGDYTRVLHFTQDINDESHPLNYMLNEGGEVTLRPTSWMKNSNIEDIATDVDNGKGLFQYGNFGKVDGALGDVLFTISNPRGLDSRPLPNAYGEQEVILSGGRYQVTKVEKKEINGKPYTRIALKDITAEASAAPEAPEKSKASKAEFIKNSDFVDMLAEYYTTAKQAFAKGALTKKDWDRIQSYFGSDSIAVNNFLRSGKRLWLANDKDTIENVIKSIDGIFSVAGIELPGDAIVFRGIYDADKLFPDGVKPGDVFDDLGYSSTSIKSDVARTFTNTDETATVLAITVPSGTKMLANNTAIQAGQQKKEKEILLPRGLTFKVTSVTERTKPNKAYPFLPETYKEIAVEIVSAPEAKAPEATGAKPSVELAAAAEDAGVSLDAYFDESFDKDDVEQATNSFSLKKTSHGQAADAVIYRKGADGFEVLMISREYGPFRGAMALPGGFRDGEESFPDTADREMSEEVGVTAADALKRTDLGTVLDSPDWDPRFVKGMSVGAVAYMVDSDVKITAGDDATGAAWVSVQDLANGKYPIAFGHATWLAEAFDSNPRYAMKFAVLVKASKERNARIIAKINEVRSGLKEPVFEQYGPDAPDWTPENTNRWRGSPLKLGDDGVTTATRVAFDDVEKLKNGSLKPPVLPFFVPMGSEDAKDGDGYYFAKSGKRYWGRWGAEGVLLRKQGAGGEVQYLLGKRADWISSGGGKWAYPGGAHVSPYNAERGGATGRAEILEELGVELQHPLVRGRETTALTYENPIEPDWMYRTVIIDASDDNVKQVQISDNETSEVGWFTADQIKEMNSQGMLHPSLNNNIEEILKLSEKTPVQKPVKDWSGLDLEKMETLPSGLTSKKGISTLDEYFEAEEAFYSLIALDREFDAGQLAAMITQSLESSNAKKSMLDRWEKDHSMSASLEDQLTDYIDSSDKIGNSPIGRWFETVDSDAIDQRQLRIEAGYEKYSGLDKIIERTGRPRVIPDVEQDFTKSNFAEIPSLMAAAQAVVNKKNVSGSQEVAISAMVDSGDIEDLEVRASTVVDENGERKLRLRYTLTSWAGAAFGNRVAKDPDYRRDAVKMPSSFLNSNKDIVLDSGTAVWQFDEGVSYVWDSEDLGTVEDQKRPFTITFVQASDDPNQEELYLSISARAPNALHNQVVIDLPLDATNAEITDALGLGGVRDPRPTTQKDLEIAVENRFLSLFGKMTDATQNAESQGKRQRMLDTIKADWGVSPSDVTVSVSSTGHIEYRIPENVAIEIEKSTGVKYMNHSIFTSAYIKDYEKQNEKKPGYIDYYSMTPRQKADVIAEGLMKLIEAGGLMSTVSRYQEGRQFFGMSSNEDMGTGGADYVFLTPADDFVGSIGTPFREEDAAIAFNARNLLQRIDIYANKDDKYGERRESQDIIKNIGVYTHEFMTKHGASLDDAKHMSVSRLVRESLLKKLAQKNISKIGGRDVEEVIIETGSKRTQDIIRSNSAGKDNILLFNNYLESIDAEPVNFNEYIATIEAASASLEGTNASYNKKTITYYPAPEGSVVLATRHATGPNMMLKDGDMLIVRHPDGTLWQYPAIGTGDYSWGSAPNVMTDSGLAATITELRLPVPDAPDWTSKQYVPLGVQKYPKEAQQIAAIESIKKGLADKTISKSSAIAKLIELAGMPITLASRAAVIAALDGMKDVPITSAGQPLEEKANLSSFIELMETNSYISSPAILEMTSGENIGSTRVVYSIRKEAVSNGQGGKQIAVMAMTVLGGMYFPLDLKTGLIFDIEKGIGVFSSRGIEYKIRGLSPSEQHKLL